MNFNFTPEQLEEFKKLAAQHQQKAEVTAAAPVVAATKSAPAPTVPAVVVPTAQNVAVPTIPHAWPGFGGFSLSAEQLEAIKKYQEAAAQNK
jgi:hypothetical protein